MESASDAVITKAGSSKRGTPNKRWKSDYDNFLIPLLVEQASKGLKCDKSFKRVAFAFAAVAVNGKFKTDFTPENVENHYRTLKARYVEIKKIRELSGAGWDDQTKTITLDPVVAMTYTEAHPSARPFINRPIENYEGLRVICGDDNATGSYATSVFSEFGDKSENEGNNNDNVDAAQGIQVSDDGDDGNSDPPIVSSPATSSTRKSRRTIIGTKNTSMMGDLIIVVGEMTSAIRNPTHWTEILYEKVMEMEGFEEQVLVDVFDYLQIRENEARGFMAKKMPLRQVWIQKFISRPE